MDEISNIKFNLTPLMVDKIIEINNLKIKLKKLEKNMIKDDSVTLNEQMEELLKEIEIQKKYFIKEFQKSNKDQISKYLSVKNKEN